MAIYRCKTPFSLRAKGVRRVVAAGELVDGNDPILKGREGMFEPVETYMDRRAEKLDQATGVEQATAAPGEKRTVSRAKSKPSG